MSAGNIQDSVPLWRKAARALARPSLFLLNCFFSHGKHALHCAEVKFCACEASFPGSPRPPSAQGCKYNQLKRHH